MELFLHQNGEQVGPFTEEQLKSMLATGSISHEDLVWHEGLAKWQQIQSIITQPSEIAPVKSMISKSQSTSSVSPQKKGLVIPRKVILLTPAILSLILGYFIGREHVKYQIRSAFTDVAKSFTESFNTKRTNFAEDAQKNPTRATATMMVSTGAMEMVAEDDVNKRYTVKEKKSGTLTTIYWNSKTNAPEVITGDFSAIPPATASEPASPTE